MSHSSIPPLGPRLGELIDEAARRIRAARRTVALTGAGLSVESGIPPFQPGMSGEVGLWEKYDPMEYGTIEAFIGDPARVWMMLREVGVTLMSARPNPGHRSLAQLEAAGLLAGTITQNVDGLHQEAGSVRVIELHGNWRTMSCFTCRATVASVEVTLARLPPRCPCGGVLKPDVILFGEIIPMRLIEAAHDEVRACDCMIVVGTSASVYPAAGFPLAARSSGAFLIEVNVREGSRGAAAADLLLEGPAGVILPELVRRIGIGREN
ncbi:MAG TPA: NAD-dependent protein deacylase [Candidatus Polarisedimenticolia bacterium]